eukprot:m.34018 g.34018  ORF g.34018 m.34018 type:complete len:60 (+) comp9717_c0_seq1:155-334(+)
MCLQQTNTERLLWCYVYDMRVFLRSATMCTWVVLVHGTQPTKEAYTARALRMHDAHLKL